MRTIGLLGGMSWESSAVYYRLINECVRERLGAQHSARVQLHSLDFAEIEALQASDDWAGAARLLGDAAVDLERGGAELLVLCTNTMHKVWEPVCERISIPGLHIADATGEAIRAAGIDRVGLLGTRYTMEGEFYAGRLRERHDLETIVPPEQGRELVHRVIYEELTQGRVEAASRREYQSVIADLLAAGAEGVILGCTEIGLLIGPADSSGPLFDSTALHADAAVRWALA